MNYSDYTLLVQERLADSNIINDLPDTILRGTNWGLRRMNRGEIGNKARLRRFGFSWQKETTAITYTSGTTEYSFSTLSVTASSFKFPWDMRITTDENVFFEYMEPTHFRYKRGVLSAGNAAYALDNDGSTRQLLIYYGASDTLDFEYYTTVMVTDGTTRKATVTDAANDSFIFQDEWAETVADYCAGYVIRNLESTDSKRGKEYIAEGDVGLRSLMESDMTVLEKKPMAKLKIRSEWNTNTVRITKR